MNLEDSDFGERSRRVTTRHGRGSTARTVLLNASVRQAPASQLAPRFGCDPSLKAIAAAWLRSNVDSEPVPLWRSQRGRHLVFLAARQVPDIVVRDSAARRLEPAPVRSHTLRHMFARNYLAGYPRDVVGQVELLGHRVLDTMRIYSQSTVGQSSAWVEQLRQNSYKD